MNIQKASGKLEEFSPAKLKNSLLRSGASPELTNKIVKHLEKELFEGISTEQIYSHAFKILKKTRSLAAPNYNLKRAVMNLGPTGFPFEQLLARVLTRLGCQVQTNQVVAGQCLSHEIDVTAIFHNQTYLIEAKYHNRPGRKEEVKTALYLYARFLDLKEKFDQAWLITNTKVTSEVKKYAQCVGLKVTSWDYPEDQSLRKLIIDSQIKIPALMEEIKTPE